MRGEAGHWQESVSRDSQRPSGVRHTRGWRIACTPWFASLFRDADEHAAKLPETLPLPGCGGLLHRRMERFRSPPGPDWARGWGASGCRDAYRPGSPVACTLPSGDTVTAVSIRVGLYWPRITPLKRPEPMLNSPTTRTLPRRRRSRAMLVAMQFRSGQLGYGAVVELGGPPLP